jgi:hypothetical protein
MPNSRSVFYGFGGWVGQQQGPTSTAWWPTDPQTQSPHFDQSLLITSDLAKNPQMVRLGGQAPTTIDVDDPPLYGGGTKLGPTWPTGSTINAVWMESNKWAALAAPVKPPRIPTGYQCRDYELTTVVYWTGPLANRRFWGYYAEITSEQGANALCSIWPAARSLEPRVAPAGSWWLNLSQVAHPIEPGFTAIGVGVTHIKQGALFLDSATTANLGLSEPKLPRGQGL